MYPPSQASDGGGVWGRGKPTQECKAGDAGEGLDRMDELHPRRVAPQQPPPLQQGGAVAATELQPVVKDSEFWKQ